MEPNEEKLVFQCAACGKILTTVKGLKSHNKTLHNKLDVGYDDYKLIFEKTGKAVYIGKGGKNSDDHDKHDPPDKKATSKLHYDS